MVIVIFFTCCLYFLLELHCEEKERQPARPAEYEQVFQTEHVVASSIVIGVIKFDDVHDLVSRMYWNVSRFNGLMWMRVAWALSHMICFKYEGNTQN